MPEILEFELNDLDDILRFNASFQEASHPDFLYKHHSDVLGPAFEDGALVAVGCRGADGAITALSLAKKSNGIGFDFVATVPQLGRLLSSYVYLGMNTIISPDHRSPALFRRLIAHRSMICRQRGGRYVIAGIAPDNIVSLGCSLSLGARIVGMHRCEGVHEFTILGDLTGHEYARSEDVFYCDRRHHLEIKKLIFNGYSGFHFDRKKDKLTFSRTSLFYDGSISA